MLFKQQVQMSQTVSLISMMAPPLVPVAMGSCCGYAVFLSSSQHIPQARVQGRWDAHTEHTCTTITGWK